MSEAFTFELRKAWLMAYTILKENVISTNYTEAKSEMELYTKYEITPEEIDEAVLIWRKKI